MESTLDALSLAPADRAVAIGVFDGVHRGHRELLKVVTEQSAKRALRPGVITFDPNPLEVLRPAEAPARLSTVEQRRELMLGLGIEDLLVLEFNTDLSELSAEEFASQYIFDGFGAKLVVVGENFRFGHRATGDVALLTELGAGRGIEVLSVRLVDDAVADVPVSSTLIRSLIADGQVESATRALVRPHRVEGEVVRGDARGADLGYPTANVSTTMRAAIPADGVYAGQLVRAPYGPDSEREPLPAAISVGTNPQFQGQERRVEAYVIDGDGLDLYGEYVAVDFVARLRGQRTFDSVDGLVEQMGMDVQDARRVLGA